VHLVDDLHLAGQASEQDEGVGLHHADPGSRRNPWG
jgi:hypothetical protein